MGDIIKYGAILENHYYSTNGSAVKYETRNICADSTAKILEELGKILFPDEEIEIYVIPAKDGCHQDTFRIKNKNFLITGCILAAVSAIFIIPGQISQIATDSTTRELNESQIKLNKKTEEFTILQIEELRKKLNKINPQNNITNEQYKEIIENKEIKKNKNRHFEKLRDDNEIIKEKIIAKQDNKIIFEKIITRNDFLGYIEAIEQFYIIKTIEKIHNLTVIKSVNEEEHKTLTWDVEDINGKSKFGVHMCDDDFYEKHLEEVLGLKTLIARVRYTFKEDQDGMISKKDTKIILVYEYNGIERVEIPELEKIIPAPFEIGNNIEKDFNIIEKTEKKEVIIVESNQLPLFQV